jgi:hypothetical protein
MWLECDVTWYIICICRREFVLREEFSTPCSLWYVNSNSNSNNNNNNNNNNSSSSSQRSLLLLQCMYMPCLCLPCDYSIHITRRIMHTVVAIFSFLADWCFLLSLIRRATRRRAWLPSSRRDPPPGPTGKQAQRLIRLLALSGLS